MTQWLAVGIAFVAIAAAAVFGGLYLTVDSEPEPVAAQPCGDRSFGHIRSLRHRGNRYELRFDPALWLSGVTANTAAAEDGSVQPGEPVPNDYYIVDKSRRTLRYVVDPNASVTVLTNDSAGIRSTSVDVAELEEIVRTGKSSRRKLFESLESGVWIRTRIDTACALDQQYRP